MKTLRKIRKNEKALSPVVASIILIAVTVAVSIAVAAWMGALTVGFMETSTLTITAAEFTGTNVVTLTLQNSGTSAVTIATAKINGDVVTIATNPSPVAAGDPGSLVLTSAWTAGNAYKMDIYDTSGQLVGSYQANA